MKKLIVVADWAGDSLTCQEVRTTVEGFLDSPSSPNINFISSTPSTIHTSFLLSQVTLVEEKYGRPHETVIFQNTDPRIQTESAVEVSQGAEFIILRMASGILLCGPNAGYDFSLLKSHLEKVYVYRGLDKGSQFRSRDLYARVCAYLMDGKEDDLDLEEISSNLIPELRGHFVAHIDNFGNIKTTIKLEDFKGRYEYDSDVPVTINGIRKNARYVNNFFGGKPGELVIFPGSSGEKDNPYLEITVWRHFTEEEKTTGTHLFNNPLPGIKIEI